MGRPGAARSQDQSCPEPAVPGRAAPSNDTSEPYLFTGTYRRQALEIRWRYDGAARALTIVGDGGLEQDLSDERTPPGCGVPRHYLGRITQLEADPTAALAAGVARRRRDEPGPLPGSW